MKSKSIIYTSAILGGFLVSFFQVLKPPPYSMFAAIVATWLFFLWANGTKPDISYSFFIVPTLFFGIGCVGPTLLVCKVLLVNQVIIFNDLPLIYCPVLKVQSYLSPILWFIVTLMVILYGVKRENIVYNKKMTVLIFVMLIIFFVFGLIEEITRVFAYIQTVN